MSKTKGTPKLFAQRRQPPFDIVDTAVLSYLDFQREISAEEIAKQMTENGWLNVTTEVVEQSFNRLEKAMRVTLTKHTEGKTS